MNLPFELWILSFFVMTAYLFITFLFWFSYRPKWERTMLYLLNLAPVAMLFLMDENIFCISIFSMLFNTFAKIANFPQKISGRFEYKMFRTFIFEAFQLIIVVILVAFYFYVQPKIGTEQFWQPSP